MTKRLKILVIAILTAATLLCAGLALYGTPRASAATEMFSFTGGAYWNWNDREAEAEYTASDMSIGFKLNKNTPDHNNILNEQHTWHGSGTRPYYLYTVDVYKKDSSGDVKLFTEKITFRQPGNLEPFTIKINRVKHVYYTEDILFANEVFDNSKLELPVNTEREYTTEIGAGKMRNLFDSSENGKIPSVMVVIRPNSPNCEYYVTFSWEIFHYTAGGWSWDTVTESGSATSDARSLHTIFSNMELVGDLDSEYEAGVYPDYVYNYAKNVLTKREEKTISVTYFEQISGTPFATTKTESATVTAINGNVTADDIASALGKKSFDCMGSYCSGFENSGVNYRAKFYKNVWLRARTTDGNDYNYYLDINESYANYYNKFVNAGIFDRGAYETVFSSKIYSDYSKELAGYTPETIYGYFGFAIIPKSYGINTLWKEFFDTETSKSGAVYAMDYGVDFSHSAYDKLLKDYNYAFLGRIWNDVWNVATTGEEDATCYILYAKPGTKTAFVAENGADNSGGAATQPIRDFGKFIGDAWNGITGFFKGMNNTGKVITSILIVVFGSAIILEITYRKER